MGARVRQPEVSGAFYEADPEELRSSLERMLLEAAKPREGGGSPCAGEVPKAVIAPHAAYAYSGPVAASVYSLLGECGGDVRRVVLLGPAHRYPFHGLALPNVEAFATPLGEIPLDAEAVAAVLSSPHVRVLDEAHRGEHSLEVHLPFLQVTLGEFSLVPLVVGDADPTEVAQVLEMVWGGPETLIVVSSDLSHFLGYDEACILDMTTAAAIEALAPDAIQVHQACGRVPIGGLLQVAASHGLHAYTEDLRNSGDIAGRRDQVVGYGGFVFVEH